MTNVVEAIIKNDNYFLIVQRNKNKHMGLKWEFPGGKVEENETFEEALVREINEELSIKINLHKLGQYQSDIIKVVTKPQP